MILIITKIDTLNVILPFQDPTNSCRVTDNNGESCYCDSLCFERNDCCYDAPLQAPCVPCK